MKKSLLVFLMLMSMCMLVNSTNVKDIKHTMKCATHFMMDSVSHNGGFVWNYLLDQSRCWGELEASPSMVWVQAPGTPEVGNVLLEAYHATSDEYYYQQACNVANILIKGQHKSGGWNYCFDINGEDSLKKWYATIGRCAWRLEEFQHYYGNATFDDRVTINAGRFFLNLYLTKKDSAYFTVLNKVIKFVCDSQYDNGGWPQRFPLMYDHPFKGKEDYSSFITLNDEVLMGNINFLKDCRDKLHRSDLDNPIKRAMYLIPKLQQPKPFAGWSDQYTIEMKPAHARSYEPKAINSSTTVQMIWTCRDFFAQTGDSVFIRRIPEAIEYLQSLSLGESDIKKWNRPSRFKNAILVPRFVDPDTGRPLYVHRCGTNVFNGQYYTNEELTGTIGHYSSATWLNLDWLTEHKVRNNIHTKKHRADVDKIIKSLDARGRWITPISEDSHPYKPLTTDEKVDADSKLFVSTLVGDEYDTSPFSPTTQVMGISTAVYISNMKQLIESLKK